MVRTTEHAPAKMPSERPDAIVILSLRFILSPMMMCQADLGQ